MWGGAMLSKRKRTTHGNAHVYVYMPTKVNVVFNVYLSFVSIC